MAIVGQSLHRWWMAVATTVATMLATADASTCEAMGKGRSAVACGVTGGCPEALSDDAQVPDRSRLVTADRLTGPAAAPTCSGPYAGSCPCGSRPRVVPPSKTGAPVHESRSKPAAIADPDGPVPLIPIARLRGGSTHRPPHRRPHVVPKIVPSCDPNDDTTSGDPDEDDDDETSKFLNGSDDTDVPIIAWVEERTPCPIAHQCAPVTWTAPPSSSLLTLQRLRC